MPANCPQCGDSGDLEVGGRGAARCSTCGGAFLSLPAAFAALKRAGVDGAQLQAVLTREGRRVHGCVTCEQMLTTFPLLGETFHACMPCQGVWATAGSLDRIAAKSASAPPAPTSQTMATAMATATTASPATTAPPNHPATASPATSSLPPRVSTSSGFSVPRTGAAGGVMPPPSAKPAGSGTSPGATLPNALAPPAPRPGGRGLETVPANAPRPDPNAPLRPPTSPSIAAPIRGATDPKRAAPPSRDGKDPKDGKAKAPVAIYPDGEGLSASRLGMIAVGVLVAVGVAWAVFHTPMTSVGGGREAAFWDGPVKRAAVMAGTRTATRFASAKKSGEELAVLHVPGAGLTRDGGSGDLLLIEVLGGEIELDGIAKRMGELSILNARFSQPSDDDKPRKGRVRAYFTEKDAWLVTATATDDGAFARSREAERFLSSLSEE